jgi:hypothetical protein
VADDLRDRYAEAIRAKFDKTAVVCDHSQVISFGALADAVLAVRDEELERLRAELAGVKAHATYLDEDVIKPERKLHEQTLAERDALKATIERIRRTAQVWIDIRPTKPTADNGGHVLAYAGQQILAALDTPGTATDTEGDGS